MREKKPLSLMIIIFTIAMFCSYHIYYYVVDKTNDSLIRNYNVKEVKKDDSLSIVKKVSNENKSKDEYFAILEIPKINLVEGFYNTNNSDNNVNRHVTMLKESTMPSKNGSILYLAAHSGSGYIAYFKNLDKLRIGDIVNIKYQDKSYSYSISDIYETVKDGTITVNHNIHENYLVLTTCSKNKNQQLVITSKLIKQ